MLTGNKTQAVKANFMTSVMGSKIFMFYFVLIYIGVFFFTVTNQRASYWCSNWTVLLLELNNCLRV